MLIIARFGGFLKCSPRIIHFNGIFFHASSTIWDNPHEAGFSLDIIQLWDHQDATKMSPLIFVLSAGSDPVADMLAFAEASGMGAKLESISLGQGQGPKAAKMIEKARESGGCLEKRLWFWIYGCNILV